MISLRTIVFGGEPILQVAHDEDDHGWQFLDGQDVDAANAALVALKTIVALDPTVLEVANLPPGWIATRDKVGGAWQREANR